MSTRIREIDGMWWEVSFWRRRIDVLDLVILEIRFDDRHSDWEDVVV